ncbi:CapA family protein [Halochromatium glycolicum]|uniref:Capsule synthesis protein CapA domain-containing protein n=1 Tax=Halochromatium glycolicum TaxID=85075 RepID=A0AAJ0U7Y3_9GAMM|nr:CapA family protein [Halochromatium glycolicum]MBK1706979.1 hypothetical protein [Halochromatium glycolicum]
MELTSKADLNIFNLESPLVKDATEAKKAGPVLAGTSDAIPPMRDLGFQVATLANNHMMDFGVEGLQQTLSALTESGIASIGAGLAQNTSRHVLFHDLGGIRVGLINAAEQEFGVVDEGRDGVVKEDVGRLFYWIREAKANADCVVLILHGGSEYYPLPSPGRKAQARLYADFGADAVIYHHTHVVSAYEEYGGKPIFYGVGNFLFEHQNRSRDWNTGMVACLVIDPETRSVTGNAEFFKLETESGVELLEGNEATEVRARIDDLSQTVSSDAVLAERWAAFCRERHRGVLRLTNLIPRWQSVLLRYGLLKQPSFHENSLLGGLNSLRCRSHREVAITVLEAEAARRFNEFVR